MSNYEFRFVITQNGRIFKLDGWTPVREIINNEWSKPTQIDKEELFNATIIDENTASKFANNVDVDYADPSFPLDRTTISCLFNGSMDLYEYLINNLEKPYKNDDLFIDLDGIKFKNNNKEYVYLDSLAYIFFLLDVFTFDIDKVKNGLLSELINSICVFFRTIFPKSKLSNKEINTYFDKVYNDFVSIRINNPQRNDYILFNFNKNYAAKKRDWMETSWDYFHKRIFLYWINSLPIPEYEDQRFYLHGSITNSIIYFNTYKDSFNVLINTFKIIKEVRKKAEEE